MGTKVSCNVLENKCFLDFYIKQWIENKADEKNVFKNINQLKKSIEMPLKSSNFSFMFF
jgi:hypothetical protein